ncbi:MAG: phosphoribosylformylglycinamidine synthase [Cytophagia bacterium]|nr:phosphoribosylformylglycinamidine synthase [Cytophagia bacterium]
MKYFLTPILMCMGLFVYASTFSDSTKMAISQKVKINHAEPLYIDLIRDLGARKGEREWNIGLGMTDKFVHDKYIALIEYEWAVADRLGLEVELPFSVYLPNKTGQEQSRPSDRLESIKTAAQWTFLVKPKAGLSMALGTIHELHIQDFDRLSKDQLITGNVINPFLVAAKRLGADWHSLIYAGPKLAHNFKTGSWHHSTEVNTNFHYVIPGTKNFVGIELNKSFERNTFDMVIRPQMRLLIHDSLMVGIVPGIPVSKEKERLSSFLRLIYEPRHKK